MYNANKGMNRKLLWLGLGAFIHYVSIATGNCYKQRDFVQQWRPDTLACDMHQHPFHPNDKLSYWTTDEIHKWPWPGR